MAERRQQSDFLPDELVLSLALAALDLLGVVGSLSGLVVLVAKHLCQCDLLDSHQGTSLDVASLEIMVQKEVFFKETFLMVG